MLRKGHRNQTTKQAGEYLVAAMLCKQNIVATTFTGNVPNYDILASNESGKSIAIQVKTINKGSWQHDISKYADVSFNGHKQIVGKPYKPKCKDIIYVLVYLDPDPDEKDRFFILEQNVYINLLIKNYNNWLDLHGGIRPKRHDSTHGAVKIEDIKDHENKWGIIMKYIGV